MEKQHNLSHSHDDDSDKSTTYDGYQWWYSQKQNCFFHAKTRINSICVKTSHESVFSCINCLAENHVQQSTIIPIDQVLKADEKIIFQNFPFSDHTLTNEVKHAANSPPKSESLKQEIEMFFKEFRATFLAKLEKLQFKMLENAQTIQDFSKEISDVYNQMSKKYQLQEIISDEKMPLKTKSEQIKLICSEVLSKEEQNSKEMRSKLNKVKLLEQNIDFNTPKLIKQNIINQLDQINMFFVEDINELNQIAGEKEEEREIRKDSVVSDLMKLVSNKFNDISDEQKNRFESQLKQISVDISSIQVPKVGKVYDQIEQLDQEQQSIVQQLVKDLVSNKKRVDEQGLKNMRDDRMQLKAEDLIALISNKTNFCTSEFLEDSAEVIRITKGILEQFYVRKTYIDSNESTVFNQLNQNQLINFSKLAGKVNELTNKFDNQYLKCTSPVKDVQNNSTQIESKILNLINSNDKFDDNSKIKRVQQILVDFPIFELISPFSEFEGQKYLPIHFNKTEYEQSSEMRVTQHERGQVSFSIDSQKQGQVATQALNNENGYLLKLKFNRPYNHNGGQIRIALAFEAQIHQKILPLGHTQGFCSMVDHGATKIIRGKKLSVQQLRSTVESLEFRWCISKRQFFFSDSSYANINQVEEDMLNPNKAYCFGIHLGKLLEDDWSVTVTEFSEINPNDVARFK